MIRISHDAQRNRTLEGLAWLLGAPVLAWFIGNWILGEDVGSVIAGGMILAGIILAIAILSRWRLGLYLFLVWIVFEDMARKYLGNSIYAFFGKDILVAFVYAAFFFRRGPRAEKLFRPSFWLPLVAFFLWATMEAFNFQTPSPLYGLLGLKLYFYYVPLMFVGYALVRTEFELRRFLVFNLAIAGVVALLGAVQAIWGQSLLNPAVLDENLQELGDLSRVTPISGLIFNRPTSVFVSDGRFGAYLILMLILSLSAMGYFIQRKWVWSKIVYIAFGLIFVATLLSGVRTALIFGAITTVIMLTAIYRGSKFGLDQLRRIFRTMRRLLLLGAVGVVCLVFFFPKALGSRWAFYTETLTPNSRGSELHNRLWDYPLINLEIATSSTDSLLGRGLGTASLGTQYVTRFLHAPAPGLAVENGYGQMLLEMGIPGLLLWMIFSSAIVFSCWSVVKRLRHTPLYAIGFGIFWYTVLVLFPLTYVGLSTYQNYLVTAFLWILIGILFRLPLLLKPVPAEQLAAQQAGFRSSALDQSLLPVHRPMPQPPPKSI
jgi:hypothetical protein